MCGQLENSSGLSKKELPKKKLPKMTLTDKGKSSTINSCKGLPPASQAGPYSSNIDKHNLQLIAGGGSVTQRAIKQLETLQRATASRFRRASRRSSPKRAKSLIRYYRIGGEVLRRFEEACQRVNHFSGSPQRSLRVFTTKALRLLGPVLSRSRNTNALISIYWSRQQNNHFRPDLA